MLARRPALLLLAAALVPWLEVACGDDPAAPASAGTGAGDAGVEGSAGAAPDGGGTSDLGDSGGPDGAAPRPPLELANLWIDATAGICARSATPVRFDPATACGPKFDEAWGKAAPGDTIAIRSGTYGPQVVSGDKASETRLVGVGTVTIAGNAECKPEFGSDGAFCANARHLTLENAILDSQMNKGSSAGSQINAPDVTYLDVRLHGQFPAILIAGPRFTWRGGSHGQDGVVAGPWKCDESYGEPVQIEDTATGATLDRIRFNPKTIQVGAGTYCGPDDTPHLETIRINGASDVTIARSWFVAGSDAGSGHIFTSTGPANLTLLGNLFEPVNGTYAIQATSATSWFFAYNTFEQATLLTTSAFPWIGNLGVESPGCDGNHVKNLWQGSGPCGSDTFVGSTSLGIGSGGHLVAGSPAVDAAEVPGADDVCTHRLGALDFEGTTRPRGAACDVGAHER